MKYSMTKILCMVILACTIISCKVNHFSYNVVLNKEYDIVTEPILTSNAFVLRSYVNQENHILSEMIIKSNSMTLFKETLRKSKT